MMTHRDKPKLIALAMVAALAVYAGLVGGPTDEAVLADAVRSLTSSHAAVVHPAAVAVVHPDEGPQQRVIDITVSRFPITPNYITLKKWQPAGLSLTSTDYQASASAIRRLCHFGSPR
jgi:hypothetical protein